MKPFTNFVDFNLATAVLARLPAYLPQRDGRVAHFLTHHLTDTSTNITAEDITPFESCVRLFEPKLLDAQDPFDSALKQKMDSHAALYPEYALPHFVLSPPSSQVNYFDYPRCQQCDEVLPMRITSTSGNSDQNRLCGVPGMARVFMQQYGTQGRYRAVQLHCQCQNSKCKKRDHKIHPNRIEYMAAGHPSRRQYLPEALASQIFISTDHVFFEKSKLDLLRAECMYKITMMKGEGEVSRYFNSLQVALFMHYPRADAPLLTGV